MKNKAKRFLFPLLATALVFSQFAALSVAVSAADPLKITQHPTAATYTRNQTATPLKATFSWPDAYSGSIGPNDPIELQWYWTLDPLVMNEQNGAGSTVIPYSRPLEIKAEHTPNTSTVGVRYYYAVVTYTSISLDGSTSPGWKARTNPARVEVLAPEDGSTPGEGSTSDDAKCNDCCCCCCCIWAWIALIVLAILAIIGWIAFFVKGGGERRDRQYEEQSRREANRRT